MSKQFYQFTRRHGTHAAGEERELTETEAIRITNEAPGVIVRMERPKSDDVRPVVKTDSPEKKSA